MQILLSVLSFLFLDVASFFDVKLCDPCLLVLSTNVVISIPVCPVSAGILGKTNKVLNCLWNWVQKLVINEEKTKA